MGYWLQVKKVRFHSVGQGEPENEPRLFQCMDLNNLNIASADPFAGEDAAVEKEEKKKKKSKKDASAEEELGDQNKNLVHIRVQQRNGRKCITTVQGLDSQLDLKKILKAIKKAECCNGTVVEDEEMGQILQFQGDQRDAVGKFLSENEIVQTSAIKKHGAG